MNDAIVEERGREAHTCYFGIQAPSHIVLNKETTVAMTRQVIQQRCDSGIRLVHRSDTALIEPRGVVRVDIAW